MTHDQNDALKPTDTEIASVLLRQQKQFRAFLAKQVSDPGAVEDLMQECLFKASQSGGELRNDESITAWFFRILRNATTDYYRSRAAEERKVSGYLQELITHQADRVSPDSATEAEVCGCLSGLLETLRPAYAELLKRIDLGGESSEKVAEDLEITSANLHVRLHRARQALKTSLERSC